MRPVLTRLSLCAAAALLLACADGGRREAAPALLPVFASADQAYMVARGEHLAMRFVPAIAAYRAALQAAPGHINASNGLATLYAEQGDFARAIALWQALTAAGAGNAGPDSSFLFSNLGYAHFLSGQFEQALVTLEQACVLDPLNHRAWQHLGGALDKVGQHERAQLMYRQARALQSHDFKADYAVAERAGVAAIDGAVRLAQQEQQWDQTEVRESAGGIFVMRRVKAGQARAPAAMPIPAARTASPLALSKETFAPLPALSKDALVQQGQALLEIRNGNGVTGMARSLAGTMGEGGMRVVRLSNQKGFGVRQTRIEYQPEFRAAAQRLAGRFGAARIVVVDDVGRADVRLVIGRDLMHLKALPAAPQAAAIAAGDKPGPKAG